MDSSFLLQSAHFILPVTIAVAGFFIYLFGFQSVKEPDYSYINNIVATRKRKQQPVKKNGVVQVTKPTTPVIKPKVEAKSVVVGKENAQSAKKPTKKVEVVDNSAELDQGDWLPAPVRGAANRKAAAAKQQASPKKAKATDSPVSAKKNKSVLKEVQNTEEIPVAVEAKPEVAQKKTKKVAPKKDVVLEEVKKVEETVEEVVAVVEAKSVKKAEIQKLVEDAPIPDNTDLWEESKSRGNKKKARARKD